MSNDDWPDWNAVLRVLAADDRREILRYVGREGDVVEPDDIVEHLVDGDDGADPAAVAVHLRHVHLPQLHALELIDWRERRRVAPGPLLSRLPRTFLEPELATREAVGRSDD